MARFVTKDSVFEGRQLVEGNIKKLTHWMGAKRFDIRGEGDNRRINFTFPAGTNQAAFPEGSSTQPAFSHEAMFGDWILADRQYKVVEFYTPEELANMFDQISVHDNSVALIPKVEKKKTPLDIENRFGFHKATIEGPNATAPKHANLRIEFKKFAKMLDELLPDGRNKSIAMTELEAAGMWAHKAIAEKA